jgi:hypothetical protein
MALEITKKELEKLIYDFQTVANRFLETKYDEYYLDNEGMRNLDRFIKFIEERPILSDFIQQKTSKSFDFSSLNLQNFPQVMYQVPSESEEDEIAFIYQFLKAALEKHYKNPSSQNFIHLAKFVCSGSNLKKVLENFKNNLIKRLVDYILLYLNGLKINMVNEEEARIQIQVHGNNYGDNLASITSTMNIDQRNSSIGVGVNQGEINAEKLAGTINYSSQVNEVLRLIETLHQNLDSLPSDHQDVAVESLETVKAEVTTPTKSSKLKSALIVLWTIGKDVASFSNSVSAIAERLGIHLLG